MTENITTEAPVTAVPAVQVEQPNRLKVFIANHPRATRIASLTAAAVGIVAATSVVKNMQANKDKLEQAREHAGEAFDALSDSVVTPDPEA